MSSQPAPLSRWMLRWMPRRPGHAASVLPASRIEVRPPELWPSSLTWRGSLARWWQAQVRRLPEPARPPNRLAQVKDEFLASLSDLDDMQAELLAERIARARSLRELWHLRSATYNTVARSMSQSEAERRLGRLNRHFPTRATRGLTQASDA